MAVAAAQGQLLPTPLARDYKGTTTTARDRVPGPNLPEAVSLLPTPTASDSTGGKLKARGSMLKSLPALLPTPEASDGSGGRVSAEVGGTRPSGAKRSVTLATAVHHETSEDQTLLPTPKASDGPNGGPNMRGSKGDLSMPSVAVRVGTNWGKYTDAVARWEALTRPAPAPTVEGRNGQPVLNPKLSEWMMGLPDGHVTDHPGLPRTQALKILGNGVVPQQAAHALADLLDGWI
ncbi:DNA methylase [Gordonia phage Upyo]|nr:DNA methylase [Gordonia phage Upyo]